MKTILASVCAQTAGLRAINSRLKNEINDLKEKMVKLENPSIGEV